MRKSRKNKTSGAPGGPKTDAGKARSSLNALKHGPFSRHGSLLKYECDRTFLDIYRGFFAAWAPANPIETSLLESANDRQDHADSGLTLRTLDVYRKLPSKPPQPIHSKRNHFDSNPNSNPERTPSEPHSDPERTPFELRHSPLRTTRDTHSPRRPSPAQWVARHLGDGGEDYLA